MRIHEQTLLLSRQALLTLLYAVQERGVACHLCVSGTSMWPSIRHDDLVTIAPLQGLLPSPGEVVAFHHPDSHKLVIHRVLRVCGEMYEMKGDNNHFSDGQVPLGHIFGRIVKVERKGRTLCWLDRRRHPWWTARYYRLTLLISGSFPLIVGVCERGIMRCQSSALYRRLAASLVRLTNDSVDYSVEIGTQDSAGVMTYRQVNMDLNPFNSTSTDALFPVRQWRMHLRVYGQRAVMLTFHSATEAGDTRWWLVDAYSRIRYRGIGLERLMIRQVADLLARSGAQTIYLPQTMSTELTRWVREGYLSQLSEHLAVGAFCEYYGHTVDPYRR